MLKQQKWFSLSLMTNQIREGILPYPDHRHLKDLEVKILVVAVGKIVRGIDETDRVASYPPKDYLFPVKKLDGFLQIIKLMVQMYSPRKYAIIKGQYTRPCLREECTKIKRTAFLGIFPASLFFIAILK